MPKASALRLELVTQHKTIGMVVLGLAVLRLVWRLFNRPPPVAGRDDGLGASRAHAGHWALYGLIFAMPLSGWLYSSAAGLGDYWWGPVSFPSLIEAGEAMEDLFAVVHQGLAITLGVMAGGHVLAALRHHFWLKDNVMKRMLPTWRKQ
jgi:cytochrome b561